MTRYIGKRERGSLRIIYIKDNKNKIVQTLINRYDIENAIIDYNKSHFQQVHQTKVYNARIYE